ncbi:MAG: F0F1 ATP synthase subunit B [Firmicutes bacterium]|nr:F0F1 ATP synthase subunit B [Bacillota bacterium]
MFNFGPTFVWVIVNLFILYLILKKILFKPVTEFMENRSNSIKADLENASKSKAEAERLKQMRMQKLLSAEDESEQILNAARQRAQKEYEDIINAAHREAEEIIANAEKSIAAEREEMLRKLRNEIINLALSAASKIIEVNMDTKMNRALVDKFIKEEGAA